MASVRFAIKDQKFKIGSAQGFFFKDFFPYQEDGFRLFSAEKWESFSILLLRTNRWLQNQPELFVFNCETVQQRLGHDMTVDPASDAVFKASGSTENGHFIRGLRLWLLPKFLLDGTVDQLGYLNILPGYNMRFGRPTSDLLEKTVKEVNGALQTFSGKVLSFETMPTNYTGSKTEPDSCSFKVAKYSKYIECYRVFYLKSSARAERLFIYDFKARPGGADSDANYDIFRQVQTCISLLPREMRVANIQVLQDSTIYRIAVCQKNADETLIRRSMSNRVLKCKLFMPILLHNAFESTAELCSRISDWMQDSAERLVAVETVQDGAVSLKVTKTSTWNGNGKGRGKSASQSDLLGKTNRAGIRIWYE